jgi:hypothetical protein
MNGVNISSIEIRFITICSSDNTTTCRENYFTYSIKFEISICYTREIIINEKNYLACTSYELALHVLLFLRRKGPSNALALFMKIVIHSSRRNEQVALRKTACNIVLSSHLFLLFLLASFHIAFSTW